MCHICVGINFVTSYLLVLLNEGLTTLILNSSRVVLGAEEYNSTFPFLVVIKGDYIIKSVTKSKV
jgi:hypothetical protein